MSFGTKSRQGFAVLKETDPELLKEICAKAGRSAHAKGVAHKYTTETATKAGKKGGDAVVAKYGIEHMRKLSHLRKRKKPETTDSEKEQETAVPSESISGSITE